MASICSFANENLVANFITGIQHTFLSDRWLEISADFFEYRLVVYWGEKIVIFVRFLFLDYPVYCEKSLLFRINFPAHMWHLPRTRVMWDACHAQYHKIWLLSSSQLCPSSVDTRSCPTSGFPIQKRELWLWFFFTYTLIT